MKLRDYQTKTLAELVERDVGRTLVIAPTGAGKGTMAVELLVQAHNAQVSSLFVVHRREIINDLIRRLKARGVDAGPHSRGKVFVRVISAQAALRAQLPVVELLIIDEAHHYAADEWGLILTRAAARRVVGFTATPERADGRSLADTFEDVIESVSYRELLARGILVPCRVLRPRTELGGGDIAQEPVDAYLRHGRNELAIFFMPTVDHAKQAHAALVRAGVSAGIVHAKTSKLQRDKTMLALERGDLRVVVNVGVLTEGVDVPHVTCIVLARSCSHASIYVQIVGRVLRACPGKKEATLIDLVGASHRHGLPGSNRQIVFEPSNEARLRATPSTPSDSDERAPIRVLDVELVEARAQDLYDDDDLESEFGVRRVQLNRPSSSKYAPKTRPVAESRTAGFLFKDKDYWVLSWSEYGERCRTGLGTKDETFAKEMLDLFRRSGSGHVERAVIARRRANCTVEFDEQAQMWLVERFDGSRKRNVRAKTYADSREEAEQILSLYRAGEHKEAERLIESFRKRARDRAKKEPDAVAAPAQYKGAKLMGQLAGWLFMMQKNHGSDTRTWGAFSAAELAYHVHRKEADVQRALEGLEDQGIAVRCDGDHFCHRAVWDQNNALAAAREEKHRPQQYRRGQSPHPGVTVRARKLASGVAYRANYVDPRTGREVFITLPPAVAKTFKTRTAWAIAKAEEIAAFGSKSVRAAAAATAPRRKAAKA